MWREWTSAIKQSDLRHNLNQKSISSEFQEDEESRGNFDGG
jgi:hypothetical protein